MILAIPSLIDLERLAVILLGIRIMRPFKLDRSQVDQIVRHQRMPLAENLAVQRQRAGSGVAHVIMPGVELSVRQLLHGGGKLGARGRDTFFQAHRFIEQRNRFVVIAPRLDHLPQRCGGLGDGGIVARTSAAGLIQSLANSRSASSSRA